MHQSKVISEKTVKNDLRENFPYKRHLSED